MGFLSKQPPEVFYKKSCFQNFPNIHRKTPVLESLFNKVAGLKACNFISNRLQHMCFPVNIAKLFKASILKNICQRQLQLFLKYSLSLFLVFIPCIAYTLSCFTLRHVHVFYMYSYHISTRVLRILEPYFPPTSIRSVFVQHVLKLSI